MTYLKSSSNNHSLRDHRDVMARIGIRFVWCTGPYFLVAVIAANFGISTFFNLWPALFMLAIPFAGGLVDLYRLSSNVSRVEDGAA